MFSNIVLFIFLIDILITAILYVLIRFTKSLKLLDKLISIFIVTFGLLVLCAVTLLICAIISIGQLIFV